MEAIRSAGMHPPSLANRANARRWRGAKRWMRHGVATVAVALACGVGLVASPRVARAGAAACIGDCDAGGSITINEIVTGVGIALESVPLDRCSSFDCNGTGRVTVDCLVRAVQAALDGCTAEPTTPPATATPTTTPTRRDADPTPEGATQTAAPETPTATPTETSMPAACGSFVKKWGGFGGGNGQFNFPAGVAVDSDGHVFVVDGGGNRVERFTLDGEFVGAFGSPGTDDGQFNTPNGIAVDGKGQVFVADSNNNRIQTFTRDGTFLGQWGSAGSGDGQFSGPVGVAVDGTATSSSPTASTIASRSSRTREPSSPSGARSARRPDSSRARTASSSAATAPCTSPTSSTRACRRSPTTATSSPRGAIRLRARRVHQPDGDHPRPERQRVRRRRRQRPHSEVHPHRHVRRHLGPPRDRRRRVQLSGRSRHRWRRQRVRQRPGKSNAEVHVPVAAALVAAWRREASPGGAVRGGTIAAPHASRRCAAPPCGHRCRGYAAVRCTAMRHEGPRRRGVATRARDSLREQRAGLAQQRGRIGGRGAVRR